MEVAVWVSESMAQLQESVIKRSFEICGILHAGGSAMNSAVNRTLLHDRLRSLIDTQFIYMPSSDEEDDILNDLDDGK